MKPMIIVGILAVVGVGGYFVYQSNTSTSVQDVSVEDDTTRVNTPVTPTPEPAKTSSKGGCLDQLMTLNDAKVATGLDFIANPGATASQKDEGDGTMACGVGYSYFFGEAFKSASLSIVDSVIYNADSKLISQVSDTMPKGSKSITVSGATNVTYTAKITNSTWGIDLYVEKDNTFHTILLLNLGKVPDGVLSQSKLESIASEMARIVASK
jgi:hypothetical protein